MVYTLDEIRERITPVAIKHHLARVYVFGSYARGEATDKSDIDLVVEHTPDTPTSWGFGEVYCDLEEAVGKRIDMVMADSLDQPADRRSAQRFQSEVKRERRIVYAQT